MSNYKKQKIYCAIKKSNKNLFDLPASQQREARAKMQMFAVCAAVFFVQRSWYLFIVVLQLSDAHTHITHIQHTPTRGNRLEKLQFSWHAKRT